MEVAGGAAAGFGVGFDVEYMELRMFEVKSSLGVYEAQTSG